LPPLPPRCWRALALAHRANLRDANLSGAQLGESIFYLADLGGADLSGANLNHAVLRSANMGNTNQNGTVFAGAMMPDNSIHE
jgi:uncharacterized protein YjbI with pentapeptide repeats